jgi:hypothetical protein
MLVVRHDVIVKDIFWDQIVCKVAHQNERLKLLRKSSCLILVEEALKQILEQKVRFPNLNAKFYAASDHSRKLLFNF